MPTTRIDRAPLGMERVAGGALGMVAEIGGRLGKLTRLQGAIHVVDEAVDVAPSRTALSKIAPNSAGGLITVPKFRTGTLTADHYAKHARGVIIKRNKAGVIKKEIAKPGGPDLPEFKSLAYYRTAAQQTILAILGTGNPGGILGTELFFRCRPDYSVRGK